MRFLPVQCLSRLSFHCAALRSKSALQARRYPDRIPLTSLAGLVNFKYHSSHRFTPNKYLTILLRLFGMNSTAAAISPMAI